MMIMPATLPASQHRTDDDDYDRVSSHAKVSTLLTLETCKHSNHLILFFCFFLFIVLVRIAGFDKPTNKLCSQDTYYLWYIMPKCIWMDAGNGVIFNKWLPPR
jgi:hypothetical protein